MEKGQGPKRNFVPPDKIPLRGLGACYFKFCLNLTKQQLFLNSAKTFNNFNNESRAG